MVWGGDGGDYFWGTANNENFIGMQGNDTLVGNDGNDRIDGRQGDDLLFAIDPSGPAADSVYGGTGEEVNGDAGQWDNGVDAVFEMEDTDPG
jgi:Ca2+-binding RTX toxin-like protein